jgi:hypothetical protein
VATAGNTVHKLQKTQYVGANNTMVHNSDVVVKGNLTVVGSQTYAQTQTLLVKDNIITLNAAINQSGVPILDAGIEIDRGSEQNVWILYSETDNAWQFTNDGVNIEAFGGGSAGIYANLAYTHANAAFATANNVAPQVQPAFDKANAAYAFANTSTAWGTRQAFVATAGQTVFSPGSGYLPGYIDVYYNGIKLYGAEDYTATDGINVTLANPATVNSIIEIVGFGANVPVANVYVLNSMASLLNRQTFFATDGQTTFTPTLSYRVGYVDVYYNGLKMNIPEDVTANNGTSINFIGLTPTTNDVIEIVGLTPNIALANAIPITGGTISGSLSLAGNVNPVTDNTYYLGSATNRWHSIFVGPGSVDIGGLKLSNTNGILSVSSQGAPATPIAGEDSWARIQANAAFNSANNVAPQLQPAFDTANAAFIKSNSAFDKANSSAQYSANTAVTDFFALPSGTTLQRPASAANGHMRYNTTLGRLETYLPSAGWTGIVADSYTVEYIVIAGGGGGGRGRGGGGGAGGYRSSVASEPSGGGSSAEASITVSPGTPYTVTVGAGGLGGQSSDTKGSNGSNSSFYSITSIGGGAGGGAYQTLTTNTGGSGGGGAGQVTGGYSNSGGAGTSGQGYPGGNTPSYNDVNGAGGGGAGAVGTYQTGGVGIASSINGTSTYRAGGGGGGGDNASGPGGNGGGGAGSTGAATNGTTNTGGGGGGSIFNNTSGTGGSGIVILRYLGAQRGTGGTVSTAGSYTVHTFTGSGTFTA